MEVVLAGRESLRSRAVVFQVKWLVKKLKLDKHKGLIEVIPRRGLAKTSGGVGLAGRHGDRIGFAYDTKLDEESLMRTVSHEMVHIKQLVKGQLQYAMDGDKEVVRWNGKSFNTSEIKYIDRPWELEAYSKQEVLMIQFTNFLDDLLADKEQVIEALKKELKEKKNGRRTKV